MGAPVSVQTIHPSGHVAWVCIRLAVKRDMVRAHAPRPDRTFRLHVQYQGSIRGHMKKRCSHKYLKTCVSIHKLAPFAGIHQDMQSRARARCLKCTTYTPIVQVQAAVSIQRAKCPERILYAAEPHLALAHIVGSKQEPPLELVRSTSTHQTNVCIVCCMRVHAHAHAKATCLHKRHPKLCNCGNMFWKWKKPERCGS